MEKDSLVRDIPSIISGASDKQGGGAVWLTREARRDGDPFALPLRAGSSLRLKNGSTQDDAGFSNFEMPHYPKQHSIAAAYDL